MSKTVVNVKLINDTSTSMGNSLLSLSSQTLWEALCVVLIGPYTLKGKDGTEIDFMCLTMIDPASSWFEMVELPVTTESDILMDTERQKGTKTHKTLL